MSPTVWGLLTSGHNLGDDMQSLAALAYLPGASEFIDRDLIAQTPRTRPTSVVLNGWWMDYPERLEALDCNLDPMLTSMHVATRGVRSWRHQTVVDRLCDPVLVSVLTRLGPVGCRDHATVGMLMSFGIPARFTGCLTTTLRPLPAVEPAGLLAVDVPRWVAQRCEARGTSVVEGTSWIPQGLPALYRLRLAMARLLQVQSASAVVTSRLHVALPALALGVPVLFVGGMSARTASFADWMHQCAPQDLSVSLDDRLTQGWPANPTAHLNHAASLRSEVEQWVSGRRHATAGDAPSLVTWEGLIADVVQHREPLGRMLTTFRRVSRSAFGRGRPGPVTRVRRRVRATGGGVVTRLSAVRGRRSPG